MSVISSSSIERGKSSASVPVTIPAGGKKTVNATGTAFHVLEAPCAVNIRMDTTAACLYKPGTGLETTGGAVFEWLELENPSTVSITVLLYVGFAKYEDKRHTIMDRPTDAVGVAIPGGLIAANGHVVLPGLPSGTFAQRRAVVVSNKDPNFFLSLLDGQGVEVCTVFPLTSVTLPVSGPLTIANPGGIAVAAAVSELWYSN